MNHSIDIVRMKIIEDGDVKENMMIYNANFVKLMTVEDGDVVDAVMDALEKNALVHAGRSHRLGSQSVMVGLSRRGVPTLRRHAGSRRTKLKVLEEAPSRNPKCWRTQERRR